MPILDLTFIGHNKAATAASSGINTAPNKITSTDRMVRAKTDTSSILTLIAPVIVHKAPL
ncbi:hypothetical protein PRUB_b0812 [Pseudoalteromonas rubra]|uniref:Uncharacterized protein n=1 Tax=Pseudoalteromonas rubra TaxID=43658 RepID=A0A8T0C0F3_9GAMM|nr:hypothetical protein PRUB_b0812 [Pseudoalteromonas rubra]